MSAMKWHWVKSRKQIPRRSAGWCRLAACMAGVLAVPLVATAQQQVQPPFIQLTAQTAGGYPQSSTYADLNSNYQDLGPPSVLEHAEASLQNLGVPFAFADAEASGAGSASADSTIQYWVQVTGPTNVVVPIIVHVSGVTASVTRAGGGVNSVASAESRMWVTNTDYSGFNTTGFSVAYDDLIVDQYGTPLVSTNNFVTDTYFNTRANVDIASATLDAHTTVWSALWPDFGGKANAALVPYFYIDPSFPDAALYSITVSPGVGNSPAPAPVPGTLLMVAAGVAGLVRRRR